jgi:hypothetical protein
MSKLVTWESGRVGKREDGEKENWSGREQEAGKQEIGNSKLQITGNMVRGRVVNRE